MLYKNLLIEWHQQPDPIVERVLWLDHATEQVVTIDIRDSKAFPVCRHSRELEVAIATDAAHIVEIDPYAIGYTEREIAPKHRQFRDQAWDVIAPLIAAGADIFIRSKRGKLVAAAAASTGRRPTTIYDYLRRYWRGGQVKNALLPRYDACGGAGKTRRSQTAKRGRPRKQSQIAQQPIGVNIDATVQDYFRRGIQLFYDTRQARSLKEAFQLTLERFFHQGYELQAGVFVPVLPPAEELPTYPQFYYWYRKERNLSRSLKARAGERQFNLRYRAVTGNATLKASGPGALYQIDATIGDIYLVSSLDRNRLIGRPVIYLVVDVFSRLIVGFSVSLEGPSWLGAILALENAAMSKVQFCQEYGIDIAEDQWPSHHLPEALLADRGELLSPQANHLVNALGIRVDNTPPYRPDWKPIVERYFRLSNDKLIHWIPGSIHHPIERGEHDVRLDAVLDLNQFRKLMVLCILDHNVQHRLNTYPMSEWMIQDGVEPYPVDLWHWGVQHQGCPRIMAPEQVRVNLLPTDQASVTPQGIYYRGLFYTCEQAVREQWFVKARLEGRWKIPVAYDPRNLDTLYLRLQPEPGSDICHLLPISKSLSGRDWHEAIDYLTLKEQRKSAAETRNQAAQAKFHAQVKQVITEATEQTKQVQSNHSSSLKGQQIRQARQQERCHERQQGAERFRPVSPNSSVIALPVNSASEDEYVPASQPIEKLRQLREEHWHEDL